MAVVSIKNKLRRGNLLVGNEAFIPNSYESISTVTVGSAGAANVEFTSIPATYSHLQVRWIGRSTSGGGAGVLTFNSDTATNYNSHYIYGYGTGVAAGGETTAARILTYEFGTLNTDGANIFAVGVMDILDYANTNKYKTVRTLSGNDQNGAGVIFFQSGLWRSNSAITSLKMSMTSGNVAQYSQVALYGIKSA